MTIDLSIIIQEYNEGRDFVQKMVSQAAALTIKKEVIYVTSKGYGEFEKSYGPFQIPVSIIANVKDRGMARTRGGRFASGDSLLFMDSHVCYDAANLNRLLRTLNENPAALISPAIRSIDFPSCKSEGGGLGYGVAMGFSKFPFEWIWTGENKDDKPFEVPFICGCINMMKKKTFDVLNSVGGGFYWEEEKSMRLWRLGRPTLSEPRAVFGHYFKGQGGHRSADPDSTDGYFKGQLEFMYANIFNQDVWNHIEKMLIAQWGSEYYKNLELAKNRYSWVRAKMLPYRDRIDERWFMRF